MHIFQVSRIIVGNPKRQNVFKFVCNRLNITFKNRHYTDKIIFTINDCLQYYSFLLKEMESVVAWVANNIDIACTKVYYCIKFKHHDTAYLNNVCIGNSESYPPLTIRTQKHIYFTRSFYLACCFLSALNLISYFAHSMWNNIM